MKAIALLARMLGLDGDSEDFNANRRYRFENLQRVLNHHSNAVIAITPAWFTLNGVGFFALLGSDSIRHRLIDIEFLTLNLSISNRFIFFALMILANIMLTLIWLRERSLGRSARKQLESEFGVSVPEAPRIHGLTGFVWMTYVITTQWLWTALLWRQSQSQAESVLGVSFFLISLLSTPVFICFYSRSSPRTPALAMKSFRP